MVKWLSLSIITQYLLVHKRSFLLSSISSSSQKLQLNIDLKLTCNSPFKSNRFFLLKKGD